jgi:hypothetical protein
MSQQYGNKSNARAKWFNIWPRNWATLPEARHFTKAGLPDSRLVATDSVADGGQIRTLKVIFRDKFWGRLDCQELMLTKDIKTLVGSFLSEYWFDCDIAASTCKEI